MIGSTVGYFGLSFAPINAPIITPRSPVMTVIMPKINETLPNYIVAIKPIMVSFAVALVNSLPIKHIARFLVLFVLLC